MSVASPLGEFYDEHNALRVEINELLTSVRGLVTASGSAWERAGSTLRDRLEGLHQGLLVHFRREEEVLYPEARRMVSEGAQQGDPFGSFFAGEAEEDLMAHTTLASRSREMISLVEEMRQAGRLDGQPLARLRALANVTAGLFERHADKEDKLIFPMIEGALDYEQMESVRSRLQEFRRAGDLVDPTAPGGGLTQLGDQK